MSEAEKNLEEREKALAERIQTLERQLERISARMEDDTDLAVSSPSPAVKTKKQDDDDVFGEPADVSEEVLSWASRTSLLPRLATLCFLMVVALILRTITDSGLVDKLIGSGIGMAYAAILMITGWHKYGKNSPLAPIMAASGAVLMSAIVVETHSHFNSLPIVPAYLTLIATGIGMALISRQFNVFTPISVGILSMCFAGAAMDYPRPFFPYLSLVLFTANILGYFAAQLKRCSWLRWSALVVTIVMLQLWIVQIVTAINKKEAFAPELAANWFLPVIAAFSVTYILLALLGILRSGTGKISKFDATLPTINVVWAFLATTFIVGAQGGNTQILGIIGVVAGICHIAVSFWLARRGLDGAHGAAPFVLASVVMLALALPTATGSFVLSLPIISITALALVIMSHRWENGSIRIMAYLFQAYCCVAIAIAFRGETSAVMNTVNMVPPALLAFIMVYQYKWCRSHPPLPGASFFGRFDKNDRSAVILLLAGLVSGFYMMRIALFQAVASLHKNAFHCSQSVLINSAAIALIMFAFLRKDKEIRNIAILVMVVGGIKVFLYDLMGARGVPLVLSVFSFGMAAAVGSLALGKWEKQPAEQKQEEAAEES